MQGILPVDDADRDLPPDLFLKALRANRGRLQSCFSYIKFVFYLPGFCTSRASRRKSDNLYTLISTHSPLQCKTRWVANRSLVVRTKNIHAFTRST